MKNGKGFFTKYHLNTHKRKQFRYQHQVYFKMYLDLLRIKENFLKNLNFSFVISRLLNSKGAYHPADHNLSSEIKLNCKALHTYSVAVNHGEGLQEPNIFQTRNNSFLVDMNILRITNRLQFSEKD